MVRFYLQKLVRDKVVKKCLDDEEVLHMEYRELNKQEFRRELLRKVHEERTKSRWTIISVMNRLKSWPICRKLLTRCAKILAFL